MEEPGCGRQVRECRREGYPQDIDVVGYWKHEFTMRFNTRNTEAGRLRRWEIVVGGEPDLVYRFDPWGGWDDWCPAGIRRLELMDEEPMPTARD